MCVWVWVCGGGEQYVNKMPKPKKRKSTREKLMPFRQQVARIKQYLTNRSISSRIGEIEDYMSPDLHYDENKTAVLAVFGRCVWDSGTQI